MFSYETQTANLEDSQCRTVPFVPYA